MNIPENLTRNPHFSRYYRTWQKNPLSVVFIPLAQICRDHGYLEEALEICEAGLLYNPDSVSGRLALAHILSDKGNDSKALEIAKKILSDFPSQQEARSLIEHIKKSQRNEDEENTDEEVTLVEEKSDKNTNLWENVTMAQIYADQGEMKIARDILHRILKRQPQNENAQALLARLGVV